MSKLLITGATGFLGTMLCEDLKFKNYVINTSTRSNKKKIIEGIKNFNVGEINSETKWSEALFGIECVIHCAARAHMMKEKKNDILKSYRKVNVEGTKNLAIQAAASGVKRFIFISSIKVNGEQTIGSSSFRINDIPKPEDAYGISKWEAEQALWAISKKTGLEIVIIRPPLVYGKGVKGNFLRLLDFANKSVPLPLAKIKNCRSFLAIENLIDIIRICIEHPKAEGNTFLISDDDCISTSDLIIKLNKVMKKKQYLFYVPSILIKLVGLLTGRSTEVKRLFCSLKVDSSHAKNILGWTPIVSLEEGLEKTVKWYLNSK